VRRSAPIPNSIAPNSRQERHRARGINRHLRTYRVAVREPKLHNPLDEKHSAPTQLPKGTSD
jgi:hypothetical protein